MQRNFFIGCASGILLRALIEGEAGSDDKTVLPRSAIRVDINHVVRVSPHSIAIGRREIDDPTSKVIERSCWAIIQCWLSLRSDVAPSPARCAMRRLGEANELTITPCSCRWARVCWTRALQENRFEAARTFGFAFAAFSGADRQHIKFFLSARSSR